MGAGATIPEKGVGNDSFRKLAGDRYNNHVFKEYCNRETGNISKQKLMELELLSDVYFLYDKSGIDTYGRSIDSRFQAIDSALKRVGIITHSTAGPIEEQNITTACGYIDEASIVVVLLTEGFMNKVEFGNAIEEHCKFEFEYASVLKQNDKSKFMIPVVLETRIKNPVTWTGPVGEAFKDATTVIDLSNDETLEIDVSMKLFRSITRIITPLGYIFDLANDNTSNKNFTNINGDQGNTSDEVIVVCDDPTVNTIRKLRSLTVDETIQLMRVLNMGSCVAAVRAKNTSGIELAKIRSPAHFADIDFKISIPRARLLYADLKYFQANGVDSSILSATSTHAFMTMLECMDSITEAMSHPDDVDLAMRGLSVVPAVLGKELSRLQALGEAEALGAIVGLINVHTNEQCVCEVGLRAVRACCRCDEDLVGQKHKKLTFSSVSDIPDNTCLDNIHRFSRLGACQAISDAIKNNPSSLNVCIEGCGAVNCFLADDESILRLIHANILRSYDLAMESSLDNAAAVELLCKAAQDFLERACSLVFSPDAFSSGSGDDWLSSASQCDVYVRSLKAYASKGQIVEHCAWSIYYLAKDSLLSSRLADYGVSIALIAALNHHMANVKVAKAGCAAISQLSSLGDNVTALAHDGACEWVLNALSAFDYDDKLVALALAAIGNLGMKADNADKLGAMGACEVVVQTLSQHKHEHEIVRDGFTAIWGLSSLKANKKRFHTAHACELLSVCLKEHKSRPDTLAQGFGAVRSLSLYEGNGKRLVMLELLPTLADSLTSFVKVPSVVIQACAALANLVEYTTPTAIVSLEIDRFVVDALRMNISRDDVVEEACKTIWSLAIESHFLIDDLVEHGACEALIRSIANPNLKASVTESALRAIQSLADSPDHRQIFIECNAVDLLRNVSRRSHLGIDVVEEAIDALKRIELGDVVRKKSNVMALDESFDALDDLDSVEADIGGLDGDDEDEEVEMEGAASSSSEREQ